MVQVECRTGGTGGVSYRRYRWSVVPAVQVECRTGGTGGVSNRTYRWSIVPTVQVECRIGGASGVSPGGAPSYLRIVVF